MLCLVSASYVTLDIKAKPLPLMASSVWRTLLQKSFGLFRCSFGNFVSGSVER